MKLKINPFSQRKTLGEGVLRSSKSEAGRMRVLPVSSVFLKIHCLPAKTSPVLLRRPPSLKADFGRGDQVLSYNCNSLISACSSMIVTPNSLALSYLLPGFSPTTT